MKYVVTLRTATSEDAERVAEIHLTSRVTAMPWLARPHTDDEARAWFRDVLLPGGTVVVAEAEGQVLGYANPTDGWLHALYVAPAVQGSGVGSALFERSMTLQPNGFDLWVFQRNTRALDFYARYGCVEVRRTDGADNEEHEPDVLLHWSPPPPESQRGFPAPVRDILGPGCRLQVVQPVARIRSQPS